MDEALKKFSAEVAKSITTALSSEEMKSFIEKTKAAAPEDSGTFEVVISTSDLDRSGEVVDQNGWNLDNYRANPVVLWGHDYGALPIGICDSIEMQNGQLTAKGRFAPEEANPFAQQVRRLYDLKMQRATSVGFIPTETEGDTITKAELLEFSFVPVPANPFALSLRQVEERKFDLEMLKVKGIDVEIKEEKPKKDDTEPKEPVEDPKQVADEPKEPNEDNEPKEGEGDENKDNKSVKIGKKGPISDEIAHEEDLENKYDKLDEVFEAINAFVDIYLSIDTAVEDFKKLLDELVGILQGISANDGADDDTTPAKAIKAMIKSYIKENRKTEIKYIDRVEVKEGRRLSGKSLKQLNSIAKNINIEAANLLAFIEDEEKVEDKPASDGEKSIQRSKKAGADELLNGLDDYLAQRRVLRVVDNVVGNALEKINTRIREKSQKSN